MQELAVLEVSTNKSVRPIVDGAMMPPVPAMLVRALESVWEQTVRDAQAMGTRGMGPMEKSLRERMHQLGGKVLGEALPLALGTGYSHSQVPCSCGGKSRFINNRPKTITTLVSDFRIRRAYYHCSGCGEGQVPLDRLLGVEGSTFSPGAREAICLLDAQRSFETGKDLLERLSGVRMHEEEGRLLAHEKGRALERQTQEELANVWNPKKPSPREIVEDARRLYFSPDGTTVLTQEKWKEAKLGTVFTTDVPNRGRDPQRLHTRYAATMGDADDLGKRLYASEKLWEVSRAVFGEENPKGKGWARRWRDKLYEGGVGECIQAMGRLRPRGEKAREDVRQAIGYFKANRRRMRYDEFRKAGCFIGSGVTESGCKYPVGQRLKQAGMRWAIEGAQSILQLRVAYLNGRWDSLWLN